MHAKAVQIFDATELPGKVWDSMLPVVNRLRGRSAALLLSMQATVLHAGVHSAGVPAAKEGVDADEDEEEWED